MENKRKWLEFQKAGMTPTRVKFTVIVHSNFRPRSRVDYSLDGIDVIFHPIHENEIEQAIVSDDYMPAFECEIVLETKKHRNHYSTGVINTALDQIFPWLEYDYFLSKSYQRWEEYEDNGQWFHAVAIGILPIVKIDTKELPDIQPLIDACVQLTKKQDKRARKGEIIRNKLKDALWLEKSSRNLSFLSYYSVIEIVSDYLCSNKIYPSNDQLVIEISLLRLGLGTSQRVKIYYLLKAIKNSFDLESALNLGEVRGKATHAENEITDAQFVLCKEIANWAAKEAIPILARSL